METVRELYRIGRGPSSSHTMGPARAARMYRDRHPEISRFRVTLYGSLAATGKGHLTDTAVREEMAPADVEIIWQPDVTLPQHPNGMRFEVLSEKGEPADGWTVFSIGGGAIRDESQLNDPPESPYPFTRMDDILGWCSDTGTALWEYVYQHEPGNLSDFLKTTWVAMQAAVSRGLQAEGRLPGPLGLSRRAASCYMKSINATDAVRSQGLPAAYALAASEENAAGGLVVTAPTCGSCGVLPAVLRYLQEVYSLSIERIHRALATAGLIGNLIKTNASISGAEVGCQGEVGAACAMAAGAAAQLLGGSPGQVEYAAEMGLEHHLGLTCDPVGGYVQIPCIERNAVAAGRAIQCATLALLTDGRHHISFDEVVITMKETGLDMSVHYKETAESGLARHWLDSERRGRTRN